MNNAEIIPVSLAAIGGGLIGVVFFGGLWWTISYGLQSKRPALVFMISLFLRTAFALIGFYVVGGGQLYRFVACALGFLGGRALLGWFLAAQTKHRNRKATNAFDA